MESGFEIYKGVHQMELPDSITAGSQFLKIHLSIYTHILLVLLLWRILTNT